MDRSPGSSDLSIWGAVQRIHHSALPCGDKVSSLHYGGSHSYSWSVCALVANRALRFKSSVPERVPAFPDDRAKGVYGCGHKAENVRWCAKWKMWRARPSRGLEIVVEKLYHAVLNIGAGKITEPCKLACPGVARLASRQMGVSANLGMRGLCCCPRLFSKMVKVQSMIYFKLSQVLLPRYPGGTDFVWASRWPPSDKQIEKARRFDTLIARNPRCWFFGQAKKLVKTGEVLQGGFEGRIGYRSLIWQAVGTCYHLMELDFLAQSWHWQIGRHIESPGLKVDHGED